MKALSSLFTIASCFTLCGWVALIALPTWPYSQFLAMGIVVTLLCVLYSYLISFGSHLDEPGAKTKGHFWSLQGVMELFTSPRAVLAGWVHYLAFDLAIGAFIVANASHYSISHWLLIPCLLLTLMFGPAGLLAYFILRGFISGDPMAINFF
jgi:hypothetical protein